MKTKFFILALLALLASSEVRAYDFVVDGIYYNINGSNATVTYRNDDYNSYSGEVIIPSTVTYNDVVYNVTSIGSSAFYNCTSLNSVTIGDGVTTIGPSAFRACSSLTSVTIPANVTTVSHYVFSGCTNLKSALVRAAQLSIFSFDDSGLETLTIGKEVSRLSKQVGGINADYYYKYPFLNLKSLVIEDGENPLTIDGYNYDPNGYNFSPFYGSSLETVHLGRNINDGYPFISAGGFFGGQRPSFETIEYNEKLSSLTIGDKVTQIPPKLCLYCSGLTSITIPESVTSIGYYAFGVCPNLTSITIPNSVTNIENNALDGTAWYDNMPDGMVYAGKVAYCYKGTMPDNTHIDIVDGTLGIAGDAFYGKTQLTSVTMPNTLMSIGNGAFYGCSGLTSITIPNSVTSISGSAFSSCSGLTSVTIPGSVTSIGNGAFYGCSGLTSVTIGSGVTSISDQAFDGCSRITSIDIPESVTSIGGLAFRNCGQLASITIPNSVTSIVGSAFNGCSRLTSVTLNSNALLSKNYTTSSNLGTIFGSQVTEYVIGEGVARIGDYAFYNCSGITSVTIPNSLTSIRNYAFYNCSGLTSVTIPNSVTSIGQYAFYGCSGLTSVNALAETPSSIASNTIPSNVTKIRVPEASVSAYKAAENWSAFSAKIMALGGEDNSITVEEIEENKAAGGSANQTYIVTDAAADDVKAADNVIVHSGDNYTCANLVLSDGEPFETMADEFTATAATYTRSVSVGNTSGTICVPYAFAKEDGVKYYTVDNTRSDDATIYLNEISDDIIPAATPVIYFKDGGKTTMTFSGSNAVAKKAAGTGSGTFELRGTFEKKTITEIDELAKSYALSGGKFLCSTTKLTINPFRAYLYNTGAVAGARLDLSVDEEMPTGITSENAALMSGDAEIEGYYTLEGKRVGSLQKGVVTVIRYANGKSVKVFAQ